MSSTPVRISISNYQEWSASTIAEAIVTVKPRLLTPNLKYNVSGLDPNKVYTASIILERVDNFKYSFKNGIWAPWNTSDTSKPLPQVVYHEHGPKVGSDWMLESIDFSWIHLCPKVPKEKTKKAFVVEHRHLYQPRLVLESEEEQFDFEDPIQRFIPVSNMTPRLKMLKELVKNIQNLDQRAPVKRKRAAAADPEPKVKRIDVDPCYYQDPLPVQQYPVQYQSPGRNNSFEDAETSDYDAFNFFEPWNQENLENLY